MSILPSHNHNKVNCIEQLVRTHPDSGVAALDELVEGDGFWIGHTNNVAIEIKSDQIGFYSCHCNKFYNGSSTRGSRHLSRYKARATGCSGSLDMGCQLLLINKCIHEMNGSSYHQMSLEYFFMLKLVQLISGPEALWMLRYSQISNFAPPSFHLTTQVHATKTGSNNQPPVQCVVQCGVLHAACQIKFGHAFVLLSKTKFIQTDQSVGVP